MVHTEEHESSTHNKFWKSLYDKGIYYLALMLVLYISVPPFLTGEHFRYSFTALSSLILAVSMIYLPGGKKANRPLHYLIILGVLPWFYGQNQTIDNVFLTLFFILYAFTAFRMTEQVFKQRLVDERVVVGAIVGYLLIGISFTFLCAMLVSADPNAFHGLGANASPYSFMYFTFVTMTTLGYGDITPITSVGQSLSVLISVTGQFYMVVVVAAIVGKYVSRN